MNKYHFVTVTCVASLFLGSNALANHNNAIKADLSKFDFIKQDAVTVERISSFELSMPPEKALPLFTAPGEILWAPGWNPNILSGDGFEKGTAWLTQHGNITTYWHVSKYDIENKQAIYTMITPDETMGTVSVAISSNDKGGSVVSVTYKLTGLSKAGNKKLTTHYSKTHYPKMIAQWKSWIESNMDKINAHH
ncbi:hypothetical protein OE749_04910 [Aestuariibacter sp. AA17]|uniref:Polyketide cyclase / dehydrase and lipid transport n=1 Tax=Fluctibacter corallii TaxID=2984329 RepID=A0ABT3A5Q6_9ALTE|nr:hypothetical protein [Aestuariibacter sp. AA17]MCV2884028.1 hypothetical protein [Aestuariibacter sp. AA17]